MRNEDLKNKLDQRPVNFDRDALWDRIEAEDKEDRRKFVWWWIGGISLVAIVGLLLWISVSDSSDSKYQPTSDSELAINEESIKGSESMETELSLIKFPDEDKELKNSKSLSAEVNEREVAAQKIIAQNITSKELIVQQSKNENQNVGTVESSFLNMEKVAIDDKQYLTSIERNIKKSKSEDLFIEIDSIENKDVVEVDAISNLYAKELQYTYPLLSCERAIHPDNWIDIKKLSKNLLLLGIRVGSDIHQFQNGDNYRRNIFENNLESIGLELQYRRLITEDWHVALGIDYTTSTTQINIIGTPNSRYVRSVQDGNTYITTTQTNHALYNRYSRVDIHAELAYSYSMGTWKVSAYSGAGIGLNSSVDGDVVVSDESLLSLNALKVYTDKLGMFATGGFRIERKINDTWTIGLDGRYATRRNMTTRSKEHTINPIGVRLHFGYAW